MWPILGQLFHQYNVYEPFLIRIYYGNEKPNNIAAFFGKFVDDVNTLPREFQIDGKNFKIGKGIKGHNGFFSCERCTIRGTRFEGRTVFPFEMNETRTDESFREEKHPEHHNYFLPSTNITPPINMIICTKKNEL